MGYRESEKENLIVAVLNTCMRKLEYFVSRHVHVGKLQDGAVRTWRQQKKMITV